MGWGHLTTFTDCLSRAAVKIFCLLQRQLLLATPLNFIASIFPLPHNFTYRNYNRKSSIRLSVLEKVQMFEHSTAHVFFCLTSNTFQDRTRTWSTKEFFVIKQHRTISASSLLSVLQFLFLGLLLNQRENRKALKIYIPFRLIVLKQINFRIYVGSYFPLLTPLCVYNCV